MTNLFQNIIFGTRSNDGIVIEHSSLNDGYRIDFIFPDKRILFIYRAEYNEDIPEEKVNHPAYANYFQSVAKVLLYDPDKSLQPVPDNVIKVDF